MIELQYLALGEPIQASLDKLLLQHRELLNGDVLAKTSYRPNNEKVKGLPVLQNRRLEHFIAWYKVDMKAERGHATAERRVDLTILQKICQCEQPRRKVVKQT